MEPEQVVQLVAGILAVVCVVIIILRRKAKGAKTKAEENDF
jgi:hypothetical protein